MDFNAWLTANGFDRETLSESQLTKLQAAWRAEHNPAPAPTGGNGGGTEPTTYDALMGQFRAEQEREREITALAASALRDHPNSSEQIDQITRLAFAGKWSVKDTELALLRGLRQQAPSPLSRGGREVSAKAVEAALAVAAGLTEDVALKSYGATTLEQAHTAFRGGLSLGELIVATARRNGCTDASLRGNTVETLRAAFRGTPMSVGFSNVSLPGILSNVGNKFIKEGFDYVDQSWRQVTAFRSTNDFKEVTTYGLVGDYDFEAIAKDGRIPHAVPGEVSYGNKVAPYGKMLTLTWVDLVNDDLGAFGSKGKKLGGGAGRKLNKVFWTEWNTLAGFNTAGFGNYDDGTDSAFDADGLEAATILFRNQKIPADDSSDTEEPLGVRPRILVVPSSVERPALRLMRSEKVLADSEAGETNVWANAYRVVAPDYMEETAYGGLATQWHLIADPNELPCIETAFLFGNQAPTLENVEVDADQLGVGMRGYWAFGVRRQERRARVTMKGAA